MEMHPKSLSEIFKYHILLWKVDTLAKAILMGIPFGLTQHMAIIT